MMHRKKDGLLIVNARGQSSSIETSIPTPEVVAAVSAGTVVIVKNACPPREMGVLRAKIESARIYFGDRSDEDDSISWRIRRDERANPKIDALYEASFFAVTNPEDEIGRTMCAVAERLAAYWRSLTSCKNTFVPSPDYRTLRPWAMYYPAGGGCFGWHQHKLEPTKVGLILSMSQIGVDFYSSGSEFKTPFGMVDVLPHYEIGDLCLFRYDLPHRVAPVDPDQELLWDGSGRWTLIIQGDPRPVDVENP